MKFILDNWFLFAAALISGGLLAWPMLRSLSAGAGLTTTEAVTLINREKAVLIDVSEPAEFAASHAKGAKNVPVGGIETSAVLPKNKALPLVVFCPTGSRSGRAVAILRKLGYEKASALSGGVAAWRAANLPIEKSA